MKKKLLLVLVLVTLLVGSVSAVSASSPAQLFFNGKELKTDVPPQIVDGRLLVPVRVVSEALGAIVTWDAENNSVAIESKENQVHKTQTQLLEAALFRQDPLSTAEAWAESVKMRNGAWQYALMSAELKEDNYAKMAENNWNTGTSSPWIAKYTVTENEKVDSKTSVYEIIYTYTDSTKASFETQETIMVKEHNGNWFVSFISQNPDITGEIIKYTQEGDEISILVEDKTAKEPYDKAHITITGDTKIYQGQTDKILSVDDLKEGLTVEVVYSGPSLWSYPVRVGAGIIRILS